MPVSKDIASPPYLFLQEDYDALIAYMAKIRTEIAAIQSEVGFSTSQSSETWHDNIMHEELMRKYAMEEANFDRYRAIQKQSRIIEAHKSKVNAGIGSTVTIEDPTGAQFTYTIGSYLIIEDKIDRISYISPLGKILNGAKNGTTVAGEIAKRPISFRIVAISNDAAA